MACTVSSVSSVVLVLALFEMVMSRVDGHRNTRVVALICVVLLFFEHDKQIRCSRVDRVNHMY